MSFVVEGSDYLCEWFGGGTETRIPLKDISPFEVKSSDYKNHKSFDYFKEKYQLKMNERYIIYTKDLEWKDDILFMPIYMTMCL